MGVHKQATIIKKVYFGDSNSLTCWGDEFVLDKLH